MADVVSIYLEGGPCAGTFVLTSKATEDAGTYVCKDGLYKWRDRTQTHDGALIFKYAGKAPAPPPVTLKAPHALGGWKALRKSINKGMPEALAHAHRVNEATLRSLDRARKVRL